MENFKLWLAIQEDNEEVKGIEIPINYSQVHCFGKVIKKAIAKYGGRKTKDFIVTSELTRQSYEIHTVEEWIKQERPCMKLLVL